MRFQYASDLHLEFKSNYTFLMKNNLVPCAPILILAGDIDIFIENHVTRLEYFQFLSENWEQVYIIPGNHEFYQKGDVSKSFDIDISVFPNVKYLNHQMIHIDGVDFFFTILWSRTESPAIENLIADFKQCNYGNNRFSYKLHDTLHLKAISWLNQELSKEKKHPRIVVSHFVPCQQANGHPPSTDNYLGPIISQYFTADLEYRIKDWDIDYWIYGHNHWDKNVDALGVKFRSNQFGYCFRGEHIDFNYRKYIEL